MKWIWIFCTLIVALWLIPPTKKEGFTSKMLQEPLQDKGLITDLSCLQSIVSEPLRYIGCGRETVVFASNDDQYVLKFFLKRRMVDPAKLQDKIRVKRRFQIIKKFRRWFHLDYRTWSARKKVLKLYETGFEKLKEEAGIVAVSLYASETPLPSCRVIDYKDEEHVIDLNKSAFVVQKKGRMFSDGLFPEEVEPIKGQLHDLFCSFIRKGFVNRGRTFNPGNYALVDGKIIIVDLGKIEYCPKESGEQDLKRILHFYSKWANEKGQFRKTC